MKKKKKKPKNGGFWAGIGYNLGFFRKTGKLILKNSKHGGLGTTEIFTTSCRGQPFLVKIDGVVGDVFGAGKNSLGVGPEKKTIININYLLGVSRADREDSIDTGALRCIPLSIDVGILHLISL